MFPLLFFSPVSIGIRGEMWNYSFCSSLSCTKLYLYSNHLSCFDAFFWIQFNFLHLVCLGFLNLDSKVCSVELFFLLFFPQKKNLDTSTFLTFVQLWNYLFLIGIVQYCNSLPAVSLDSSSHMLFFLHTQTISLSPAYPIPPQRTRRTSTLPRSRFHLIDSINWYLI